MMKNKKGILLIDDLILWVIMLLIGSPYILLGIGVFVIILIAMFYFAFGKILGAIMIVASVILYFRTKSWKLALFTVIVGFLLFFNPMGWSRLAMMW